MPGVLRDPRSSELPRPPARRGGAGDPGPRTVAGRRAALTAAVEELAGVPGAGLPDLLGLVTRHAVEYAEPVALADLTRPGATGERTDGLVRRIAVVLESRLDEAIAAGQVPAGTTSDDLVLAVAMVTGGLAQAGKTDRLREAARAWELLRIDVRMPPAAHGD